MFAFDKRYRQKVAAKTRWSRPDGSEGRQGVCLTSSARWPLTPEAKKTCAEVWQIRIQWSQAFFPFCLLGLRLSYLLRTEDYCVPPRKMGEEWEIYWRVLKILTSEDIYFAGYNTQSNDVMLISLSLVYFFHPSHLHVSASSFSDYKEA